MPGGGVEIDVPRFRRRLARLRESLSSELEAVLVLSGESGEDVPDSKTAALHHWLFGWEFPESALILRRSGPALCFTSKKKLEVLKRLDGSDAVLLARTPKTQGIDPNQVTELLEACRAGAAGLTLGALLQPEERARGAFAEGFMDALKASQSICLVECRDSISFALAPKEDEEIENIRKAACYAGTIMGEHFMRGVEVVIDQDEQVSNVALCTKMDKVLDSPEAAKYCMTEGIDIPELDMVYASLQTGKGFALRTHAEPTEELVPMQGCFVMSVGVKYNLYSACVSRTILVDPEPVQKEAYSLALEVHQLVIERLVPGAIFKDIYLAARGHVNSRRPDLLSSFAKSVGWVLGIEFRDQQAQLVDTCLREVQSGMVFCVSSGFVQEAGAWCVWVCDTVAVPKAGDTIKIFTQQATRAARDVIYELEEDPLGSAPNVAAHVASASAPAVAPAPTPAPASAPASAPATAPISVEPKSTLPPKLAPAEAHAAAVARAAAATVTVTAKGKAKAKAKGKAAAPKAKAAAVAPAAPSRPSKTPAAPPREHRATRSAAAAVVPSVRRSTRRNNVQAKAETAEMVRMDQMQIELRAKKLADFKAHLSSSGFAWDGADGGPAVTTGPKLRECEAYRGPGNVPAVRANKVHLDLDAEALLVPIAGALVPFHARTIRNMSRSSADRRELLRVNFFAPGQGKSNEDYPAADDKRAFIKELSFRSDTGANFDAVMRGFKELQKRMKLTDTEAATRKPSGKAPSGAKEPLTLLRSFSSIRDLNMRPTFGAGSRRTFATLEAHANGFRISVKNSSDRLDILYSQVRHAIFEPCEKSLIVILHLHLWEPIMVGKKKTQDIQFFTEVSNQTEDLSQAKVGSAADPDEILEEQREREMKERLNKTFKDFAVKVQAIQGCPLEFDIPYLDSLSFPGVPFKSSITLCPCAHALVGLQEWPPFVLSVADIDIVVFERVSNLSLREFDLVFVKKDFEETPIRITTIPRDKINILKAWITGLDIVWYETPMNMQWQMVMKEITKNAADFVDGGGWDSWFGGQSGSEDEDDQEESDWDDGEGDVQDQEDDDNISEDDSGGEDASDDEGSEFEGESDADGMSWDELEEAADKADRRGDAERRHAVPQAPAARAAPARGRGPPAKKARR